MLLVGPDLVYRICGRSFSGQNWGSLGRVEWASLKLSNFLKPPIETVTSPVTLRCASSFW